MKVLKCDLCGETVDDSMCPCIATVGVHVKDNKMFEGSHEFFPDYGLCKRDNSLSISLMIDGTSDLCENCKILLINEVEKVIKVIQQNIIKKFNKI